MMPIALEFHLIAMSNPIESFTLCRNYCANRAVIRCLLSVPILSNPASFGTNSGLFGTNFGTSFGTNFPVLFWAKRNTKKQRRDVD